MKKILLSSPHMGGSEITYVQDAFEKNWVAPLGENVDEFENLMKNYIGMPEGLALSAGTAALHLAMKKMGLQQGDYVFCSSLTFSASINPALYEKAIPVFIDSDEDSWNMDPKALKKAFVWAEKEHCMPRFVIVVDLYGQSARFDEIKAICDFYHVAILEDAAEALGASYHGQKCGTFGYMSALSFNGNKIITTSGGGMVLCREAKEREKMFFWSTQSREPARHYEHKEIGYNYRMSNICAGIGRGQMDVLDQRIAKKQEIYQLYKEGLQDCPITMMPELANAVSTHWLSTMTINDGVDVQPMDIIEALDQHQVESRPVWKPMHLQPIFKDHAFFSNCDKGSISEKLFMRGLCLPSDTNMTIEEQKEIITIIRSVFVA